MRWHPFVKGGKFWMYLVNLNEASMTLVQEQNTVVLTFGKLFVTVVCYNFFQAMVFYTYSVV